MKPLKLVWRRIGMSNHPFGYEACCKRLMLEYQKYGKLIVAFDFDNTIFDYHNNGGDYSCVIELLKECSKLGFELVLFTTSEDYDELKNKYGYSARLLESSTLRMNSSSLFTAAKKPYYNILLDDRAGLEESYNILKYVVDGIKLDKSRTE